VITGSLTTTGIIYAQPNGGMYFQGGDDAALYDINVSNHMGIYGVQDVTVGAIKLGSNGPVLYGSGSKLGIGTTNPSSASLTVNGNIWATSLTGSLLGTSSFASSSSFSISSSRAVTASYATQALSASWAPSTPSNPFPYTGSAVITGSLTVSGSFVALASGITSIDSDNRIMADGSGITSIDYGTRTLNDNGGATSLNWDASTNGYAVEVPRLYFKSTPNITAQENFSAGVFNAEGRILQGVSFNGASDYDFVYLDNAAGEWRPVDNVSNRASKMLGIAFGIGSTDSVLLEGHVTITNTPGTYPVPAVDTIAHGLPIYVSSSAFATTTPPISTGEYVRILGHAYYQNSGDPDVWVMNFRPDHTWVQL
jgi:hypothetical protein